jgi:hypothetical protein
MKVLRHSPYKLLSILPKPEGLWQDLLMDFIVDLLPSKHLRKVYDSILNIIDRYSKIIRFVLCNVTINVKDLDSLIINNIVKDFGVLRLIISDRELLFTSSYWSTFCYYLAIKRRLSIAFYPQADG